MDFTLSLTHFCESHGPKCVLCTQVLPLECATCVPPSPPLRPQPSTSTFNISDPEPAFEDTGRVHTIPSLRKTDTNITLPTDFSGASTNVDSESDSPTIERHPLFKNHDPNTSVPPQFRYGRAQGETCASCTFTAPESVASSLPSGAPGSLKSDGKSKNGAPVFRSREFVCLGTSPNSAGPQDSAAGGSSNGTSYPPSSYASSTHPEQCHDHTMTYLTAKSPSDPDTYSYLRASVIRTLSCELLPRGMSDGPLCFGDATQGYTIAYVFRLTDPKARGRRRCYAFLALAGKDAKRAFRAAPMLWEAFASMSRGIEGAAMRAAEEKERKEEEERQQGVGRQPGRAPRESPKSEKVAYTPVSSFLTRRAMDPDGTIRRMGQTSPRSLADIVGDETIFAILHQYFVALLRCLGDRFGGIPLADREAVYQTMADAAGLGGEKSPSRVHHERVRSRQTETAEPYSLREEDSTPKPEPAKTLKIRPSKERPRQREETEEAEVEDEIDKAKKRLSKTLSLGSTGQCAPLHVTQAAARGQVQVAPTSSRQVTV
ncbi:uncharacterized protein HMPREF1541_09210 [Cyphellophora europaea CBS 101466]|uniref:UDENN FLCN/SMCR8-type domain-containing protein n=1 Tax=Cyphellophora europaea (strain CBS 101466) TaxID=1220924 RepID=W2SBU6_CYPE1|nr:uncharacterized protein HMPREF1541_09210 [Cyphellophora europaea CBS 101466]ETN45379.1 hypothetical protein HMPREF1541_09210 [Cyphellophora europaea CBS 101466]